MKRTLGVLLAASLLSAACGNSRKPVVVGAKNGTEQTVLGEIIAQHLERRLGGKVERRFSLGGTPNLYQAFLNGEITLYPESTGIIEAVILKERPSSDPATVLERTRAEMRRIVQAELLDPLGFENPPAMVVRASDASQIDTLSAAAAGPFKWKVGVSFEFQQLADGLPALNSYHLPMSAPIRSLDPQLLFSALEKGELSMVAATTTDGHLESGELKLLADDRKVFPPHQVCLLVRQEKLDEEPRLRAALAELSGRISANAMRKMNASVDLGSRLPRDVAAEFLASLGLR